MQAQLHLVLLKHSDEGASSVTFRIIVAGIFSVVETRFSIISQHLGLVMGSVGAGHCSFGGQTSIIFVFFSKEVFECGGGVDMVRKLEPMSRHVPRITCS